MVGTEPQRSLGRANSRCSWLQYAECWCGRCTWEGLRGTCFWWLRPSITGTTSDRLSFAATLIGSLLISAAAFPVFVTDFCRERFVDRPRLSAFLSSASVLSSAQLSLFFIFLVPPALSFFIFAEVFSFSPDEKTLEAFVARSSPFHNSFDRTFLVNL